MVVEQGAKRVKNKAESQINATKQRPSNKFRSSAVEQTISSVIPRTY